MTSLGKARYSGARTKVVFKGVLFPRGRWVEITPILKVDHYAPEDLLNQLIRNSKANPGTWSVVDFREPEPEPEPEPEEKEGIVEETKTLFQNFGKKAAETVSRRSTPKGGD